MITGRPRNASITMLTSGSVLRLHGDIFRRHVVEPFVPRVDAHQAFNLARRGATLIDVRSENDYRENGLGVNIPLPMLRLKLNRLDPAAPCLFCCDSGRLSQAAAFIARQQGYDARLVKGGLAALLSVQAGLP